MASTLLAELILYLRLAQVFKNRLQMPDRDRVLVLAGSCASLIHLHPVANFCRSMILNNNPGHMIRRWATFKEALDDDDFHVFLKQLGRRFPTEKAESILRESDFRCDIRPGDYDNDLTYVAAVMGIDWEWLEENFS